MCLPPAIKSAIIGTMKRALIQVAILALLAGAVPLLSSCVAHGHAGGAVAVDVAPPAPTVGYYYTPRAGYVWVEGRWSWDGYQWQWTPGYWVAARPGFVYVQGYWDFYGGRYLWVRGRWARHRPGYVYARGYWGWHNGRRVWRRGHWMRHRSGHHWHRGHWTKRGGRATWVRGRWSKQPPGVRDHRRRGGTYRAPAPSRGSRHRPAPRRNTRVPARRGGR
jgi:hypothetical protein